MKKALSVLLAAAMAVSLAACGQNANNEAQAPADAGEAPVAEAEAAPDASNPENAILRIGAANDWTGEGMNLVFDALTYRIDSKTASKQLVDVVANDDFTEFTLNVTDGVTFSDGTPFTAENVKYTIDNSAISASFGFHSLISSVEVKDEKTVEVKFPSSYSAFEYELSYVPAVKLDALSPEGNIVDYIGTGMYVLDEFEPGSSSKFSYNENYWQDATKRPSVTTVEWKVIPDMNTRVMALENKEIDVIGVSEHGGMTDYVLLDQLGKEEGITIDVQQGSNPHMYMFNYTKGATADQNLRKAIATAVNKERLVDTICYGYGTPAYTYMLDGQDYCPTDKNLKFTYNVDEAKQILADAGYVDADGDGIVEKDGQNVVLNLVTLSAETYRNTAVLVKEDLAQIGIDVEIEALDADGYYAKSQVGDFDLCFTHPWTNALAYFIWRGATSDYDTMGTGFGFDEKFKDYVELVTAGTDTEAIQEFFDMFWKESYDFVPALPLYSGSLARVYTDEVSGFIWNRGTGTFTLIDLSEVTINRK